MSLLNCPRCDYASYEILTTHDSCLNCNYSPDIHDATQVIPIIPNWALEALRESQKLNDEEDECDEHYLQSA